MDILVTISLKVTSIFFFNYVFNIYPSRQADKHSQHLRQTELELQEVYVFIPNPVVFASLLIKVVAASDIEQQYPFKNLDPKWTGVFAPDNGVINVQLLVRTLFVLARDHGALAKDHTQVKHIRLSDKDKSIWEIYTLSYGQPITYRTKKIIIASGASVNDILQPNFGISLDLKTWEIVSVNFQAVPNLKIDSFPSK
jgi:glycine/D-amino acid oxidase-like deaminating enzyme